MTEQIKPKRCGANTWYMPNEKRNAVLIGDAYWFCNEDGGVSEARMLGTAFDIAMLEVKNFFEEEHEARDAITNPVDPTPLTWDELCEMEAAGGYPYTLGRVSKFNHSMGSYVYEMCVNTERADEIRLGGKILFAANKYWRSKESLEAWIEQQKGE